MRSHAERERFTREAMAVWADAVDVVRRVDPKRGDEVRCHELARAVWHTLHKLNKHKFEVERATLEVVDGQLGSIQHSWLVYTQPTNLKGLSKGVIIDVYAPGRLPQVQLIDIHWAVSSDYVAGGGRTDIKSGLVTELERDMAKPR